MNRYVGPLAIAAACVAAPATAQHAVIQHERNGTVSAGTSAQAGGPGWQVYTRIDVPTGKNLDFTYGCPEAAPIAVNGAFYANASARPGLALVSNFRNGQNAAKWEWIITWPAGAPPNAHVTFNVYCQT